MNNPVLFACSPSFSISILASLSFYVFIFLVPSPPSPTLSLCFGLTSFSLHPYILTKCSLSPSSQCVQPRPSFSPRCTQTRLSPSQLTVVCIGTEMLCYCVQLVCKVAHTFNHAGTRGFVQSKMVAMSLFCSFCFVLDTATQCC